MRCVSYTRSVPWKNTKIQLSIMEQNERIAEYLREHKELELQKKYSDRKNDEKAGESFEKMVKDGMERKYDCLIVASIYYCGQSFPVANQLIFGSLYEAGMAVIVADEKMDTRQMEKNEVANYFEAKRREMHAEIVFAWRKKQGEGFRLTNSVPFGYIRRNGENHLEKDNEVAPFLSEAFERYMAGQEMREIAAWLNENNVSTARKRRCEILGKEVPADETEWTAKKVRAIFRNPSYTGAMANGSKQITAENCHEPYLTKEQFYALPCNRKSGEGKVATRKDYKKPNPLAAHIFCICGEPMRWHKTKSGRTIFRCQRCCAGKKHEAWREVSADEVYRNVILELNKLKQETKVAEAAIQNGAGVKAIEVFHKEKSVDMKKVLAEMNMEQFRRVPLYESFSAGEISAQEYENEMEAYRAAHENLNARLTEIMEEIWNYEKGLSLRNPWLQLFCTCEVPEQLDRSFVKKYIERVEVRLSADKAARVLVIPKMQNWHEMLEKIIREETYGTEKSKNSDSGRAEV